MSGLACGYQLAKADTPAAALRIVDRGLFVLLVGHFLVAGSIAYIVRPGTTFEHLVITDNIGLILCFAPLLRRVSARRLLEAGAGLFVVSSAIGQLWRPTTLAGAAVAGPLFDINVMILPDNGWISATVPLAGLFFVGAGIGKFINTSVRTSGGIAPWRTLFLSGSAAVACAVALNVARHFIKELPFEHLGTNIWDDVLLATLDVRQKSPPSLAYALFYGGIGIALVGLLGLIHRGHADGHVGVSRRIVELPATIGRASFVSYVSLQWMVDFTPRCLGFDTQLDSPAASLTYLLLVTLVMFLIAHTWDRHGGNRWLTLGRLFRRTDSTADPRDHRFAWPKRTPSLPGRLH